MPRRESLTRRRGERCYRRIFVIATEGAKTEPGYFGIFNRDDSVIRIKCLGRVHKNSPAQVLRRMSQYLKEECLRESDEAWIVVDKDQWPDQHLAELYRWSQSDPKYGLAVSNPKFEYWLLLHFESGHGVSGSNNCSVRLKRHLPNYVKDIDARSIDPKMIHEAVQRAKDRDNPRCEDWPRSVGTTVYRLVESILKSQHRH